MADVSEAIFNKFLVRREVSQTPDLATLLVARLFYPGGSFQAATAIVKAVLEKQLKQLSVGTELENEAFTAWLQRYLTINSTVKGTSFYPVHPVLSLSTNGERPRVEVFINLVAQKFTEQDQFELYKALWDENNMPPFERVIFYLVKAQTLDPSSNLEPSFAVSGGATSNPDKVSLSTPAQSQAVIAVIEQTKQDLLSLAKVTVGIQAFITHAGRLLALALTRYLLLQAGVDLALPIYAAPAADTNEGVRALSHEIIETHRNQFEKALRTLLKQEVEHALTSLNLLATPSDETMAQNTVKKLFRRALTLIPKGQYAELLESYPTMADLADRYYWLEGGSSNRFLRQLHSSHLNLSKKAGIALSRSQQSQWHFYCLSPALVETLLLVRQAGPETRIQVNELLKEWRARYGLAVIIDETWLGKYRQSFRSFGSPDALDEANRQRFIEILADRGRLYKNSDDFPWVILRD